MPIVSSNFPAWAGYVILPFMIDDWVEQIKVRGLGDSVKFALDALEPLGPLGAQLLWVIQPASRVMGWGEFVGNLAETLDDPERIAYLRDRLNEDDTGV